jgi:hypothetical protein
LVNLQSASQPWPELSEELRLITCYLAGVPTPLATEPPMMMGRMWPGDALALRATSLHSRVRNDYTHTRVTVYTVSQAVQPP